MSVYPRFSRCAPVFCTIALLVGHPACDEGPRGEEDSLEEHLRVVGRVVGHPSGLCTATLIAADGDDGCVLTAGHCFDDWDTQGQQCNVADFEFQMPRSSGEYEAFDVLAGACRDLPPDLVDSSYPLGHRRDVAILKIDLAGATVSSLPRLVADPDPNLLENMVLGEGEGTRKVKSVVVWYDPQGVEDPYDALRLEGFCPNSDGPCWWAMVGEPACFSPVVFTYDAGSEVVSTAVVSGSFNNWAASLEEGAWPLLDDDHDNVWTATHDLAVGRYEYKLIIDGDRRQDPANPEGAPDGFGGFNSVLTVESCDVHMDVDDWYQVQAGDSGGPWFFDDGSALNVFGTTTSAWWCYPEGCPESPDPSGNGWSFLIAAPYSENAEWIAEQVSGLGCGELASPPFP